MSEFWNKVVQRGHAAWVLADGDAEHAGGAGGSEESGRNGKDEGGRHVEGGHERRWKVVVQG